MLLRSDHLVGALVQRDSPAPALVALLGAVGADLDALRRKLKPPRKITQLEAEIWQRRQQKEEATAAGDERTLARLSSGSTSCVGSWPDRRTPGRPAGGGGRRVARSSQRFV